MVSRRNHQGENNERRIFLISLILLILFSPLRLNAAFGAPGGAMSGGDCFQCHQDLKQKCASGVVHRSVERGNCPGCHNPHTARYDHLLIDEGAALCYRCHQKRRDKWQGLKVHAVILKEGCLGCHDAHVSANRCQLKADGQNLCFRCHSPGIFKGEYVHEPVRKGKCQTCHVPHASKEDFLLVDASRKLCLKCHGQKSLTKVHEGIDIRGSECILCHNPHASGNKGLIYSFAHQPYKERKCGKCHSGEKGTLVAEGANLCYNCHQKQKEQFQCASRSHLVKGDKECTYCHTPHASERKDLVRKDDRTICLSCHPKMAARLKEKAGKYLHPEVVKGNCTSCHDPHSSSLPYFYRADILLLCTKCHVRQKKASHPAGEKAIDPRDQKSTVNCITCHDPMGTEFKYSLRLDGSQELCEQCHKR